MTRSAQLAAATQQYSQQEYPNRIPPQTAPIIGNSPAAQYIASTQGTAAQPRFAGGQTVPDFAATAPAAAPTQYNQPLGNDYVQAQPEIPTGGGLPVPGAADAGVPPSGVAHSYPEAYGSNRHDDYPSRHLSSRKRKNKVRKILEELLVGGAAPGIAKHERRRHQRRESNSNDPPPIQRPPRGSALGFLHPDGHFVPSALDHMIDHFINGKNRNLAPEGAKTGYLHTGGHFISMGMSGLIKEFKYTLLDRHQRDSRRRRSSHGHTAPRSRDIGVSSSSSSEDTDSDDSDSTSSGSDDNYGQRRPRSEEGHDGRH